LAFSGDTPYVAYSDYSSYKATVKYYNGSTWQTLGAAAFSAAQAQYISLAFPENSSTPYVAYQDGGNSLKATVKYYDGNAWQTLGTEGFSDGQIQYTSLAFAGATPYLAYMDPANGYAATVKYYDGNAWQTLGTEAFSANQVDFISLAISAGTPYVAYRDAGHSAKVTVMYYDGAAWQNLGTPGFSDNGGDYESLAFLGGTPYVAFRDWGHGNKLTVMYYDGSTWQTLGTPGFSPGAVSSYLSMAFVGGTPYVVYQDNNDGLKATVMYYDGSTWQVAGTAGFSGAAAEYISMAVSGGTPYVAYKDGGHSLKATVMKFVASTQTGPDFVVNSNADTDDGLCDLSGQGDGNRDCTLREAINAANADANASGITFANNYTITLAGSSLPDVSSEMTISGTGAANTVVQASTCNPVTLPGACTPATYRVFHVTNTGNLMLDNLTVRYGGLTGNNNGGGIYNRGMLTVTDSTITANATTRYGGGVANETGSTLTVLNGTITGNAADYGAGIYIQDGATATLTGSTLSGNAAVYNGGGIYSRDATTLTVTDSTFSGNSANGSNGGAILSGGTLILSGSTLSGNSAKYGGGLFAEGTETGTIINSTFYGNSATSEGGGISATSSGPLTVTNSTLSGNSATPYGGGLQVYGSVTLNNSIVANSTGGDCNRGGGTVDARNSLIQDGLTCVNGTNSNNKTGDPLLSALADNGGPTQTMAPQAGSPATDAGDNSLAVDEDSNPLTTDQRGSGYARIINPTVDMGAYEFSAAPGVTSADQATFTLGNSGSFTVTATGIPTPALSETGNLPGGVTFSDNGDGTATLSGTPSSGTVGTYPITLSATNGLSPDATQNFTLTVNQSSQATLTADASPSSIHYGETSTLSTSGGSGSGAVTYAVTAGGSYCSVSGATLTGIGAGTCTVTATKAADSNYTATTATVDVTVTQASQATLTADASPSSIHNGETSTLSTSGGSGSGAVTYAVTAGGSYCSVSGTTLTGIGVGTCTVTATKAADSNYNAAIATADVIVAPITTITGTPLGRSGPTQVDLNGGGVGCGFTHWQFEAAANPPAGINFPYGVLAFTLTSCDQHGTVTLRFTYPAPLPAETLFWKFGPTADNPTSHWYTLPTTINGNQLTVQITDGELGDDDLVQNGVITDPGGAGVPTAGSGPVAVPALSLWGLGLLAALLGGAGWRAGTRGVGRRR